MVASLFALLYSYVQLSLAYIVVVNASFSYDSVLLRFCITV